MILPRLRPRVDMAIACRPETLRAQLNEALRAEYVPCGGLLDGTAIELWIHPDQQQYWSPQLHVAMKPEGDRATRLSGTIGPNARVWTMFVAAYAIVLFATLFATFVGLSQWTIGQRPWWLISIPIGLLFVLIIAMASRTGQRMGQGQTDVLLGFLDDACERAVRKDTAARGSAHAGDAVGAGAGAATS